MATTNSDFVKYILKMLMNKISRRTTETHAKQVMDSVFEELTARYDFLRYITIMDVVYTEAVDTVVIDPEINTVNSSRFDHAVRDIIKSTVRHLERDADFFFIREFKEAIDGISETELLDKGINLSSMQFQYIFDRIHMMNFQTHQNIPVEAPKREAPKYDEMTRKILSALVDIVRGSTDMKSAMSRMDSIIQTLQKNHEFLRHISIDRNHYADGMTAVNIFPDINAIEPYVLAKGFRDIIKLTNASMGGKVEVFIGEFKKKIGEEYLLELEKMGINLHFLQLKFA